MSTKTEQEHIFTKFNRFRKGGYTFTPLMRPWALEAHSSCFRILGSCATALPVAVRVNAKIEQLPAFELVLNRTVTDLFSAYRLVSIGIRSPDHLYSFCFTVAFLIFFTPRHTDRKAKLMFGGLQCALSGGFRMTQTAIAGGALFHSVVQRTTWSDSRHHTG